MRPLIELTQEEIQSEAAKAFGVPQDAVRVTKLNMGEGRTVAYIRLVWEGETTK